MQQSTQSSPRPEHTFLEAITKHLLVRAEYNATQLTLAPHQLFERHGDLFVSALNTGKPVREGDEPKLGYFKLKGLSALDLSAETFDPLNVADHPLPRETDTLIFAI